jgi:hypothetical protein
MNEVRQVSEKMNFKQQKVCVIKIMKKIEKLLRTFSIQMIKNLFFNSLPFVAFTMHDHVYAPVEQTPFLLERTYPVGTKVMFSAAFVFMESSNKVFMNEKSNCQN